MRTSWKSYWSSLCCVSVLTCLAGCSGGAGSKADTAKANKGLLSQISKLYDAYLSGTPGQAQISLLEEARVIEGAGWLPPPDKANLLFVTYSRLYVFHRKMKNDTAAEAAWIKFRFWTLRRFELSGLDTQSAMKEAVAFTPERISETVDSWDRRENKGIPPNYVNYIGSAKGAAE